MRHLLAGTELLGLEWLIGGRIMEIENRVCEDELEWDDDGIFRMHRGNRFTGVAYDLYQDSKVACELSYKNGLQDGTCRTWYPTGQIESEWTSLRGGAMGRKTDGSQTAKLSRSESTSGCLSRI